VLQEVDGPILHYLCAWDVRSTKKLYARKFTAGWVLKSINNRFVHLDYKGAGLDMNFDTGTLVHYFNLVNLTVHLGRDLNNKVGRQPFPSFRKLLVLVLVLVFSTLLVILPFPFPFLQPLSSILKDAVACMGRYILVWPQDSRDFLVFPMIRDSQLKVMSAILPPLTQNFPPILHTHGSRIFALGPPPFQIMVLGPFSLDALGLFLPSSTSSCSSASTSGKKKSKEGRRKSR
jgi:hypothetical protein